MYVYVIKSREVYKPIVLWKRTHYLLPLFKKRKGIKKILTKENIKKKKAQKNQLFKWEPGCSF